ncbi:MAG: GAF domain-containing protein [Anaerolineae bacterium]
MRLERYRAALRLAGIEIERRNLGVIALTTFAYLAGRMANPAALLKLALSQALEITGASVGAIVIIEPESKALVLGVHQGLTAELRDILTGRQLGYGATALMPHLVAGSGALLEVKSTDDETERLLLKVGRLTSLVSLPIQIEAKLTGALLVGLQDSRSFRSAELSLLMAVSQVTANTLEGLRLRDGLWYMAETLLASEGENAELQTLDSQELKASLSVSLDLPVGPAPLPQPEEDDLEKLLAAMMEAEDEVQQQHRDLQTLNALAEMLNRTLNLKEILQCAVSQAKAILGTDAAWIYLLNTNQLLELSAHIGLSVTYVRGMRLLEVGEGVEGAVAAKKEPQFINEINAVSDRTHKIWVDKEQLQALAAVPITRPGVEDNTGAIASHSVGVLAVGKRDKAIIVWTPREMRLLTSIANQVALAIDNARLYAQIQEDHTNLSGSNEILRELNELLLRKIGLMEGFLEDDLAGMLVTASQILRQLSVEESQRTTALPQEKILALQKIINRLHDMAQRVLTSS